MSLPKCPNHGCQLNKTGEKRLWKCPVSSAIFEADADDQSKEVKYDKFGKPLQEWKVTSLGEE